MTSREEFALQFWSAAYFVRRSKGRDRATAIRVLESVSTNAKGPVADRAGKLLTEINNVSGITNADG
jgi:hypothetical protein